MIIVVEVRQRGGGGGEGGAGIDMKSNNPRLADGGKKIKNRIRYQKMLNKESKYILNIIINKILEFILNYISFFLI